MKRELESSKKVTIMSAPTDIPSLQQAQIFGKKHIKLEEEGNNHSVEVDKVVESSKKLLSGSSYASEVVTTHQFVQISGISYLQLLRLRELR